MEARGYDASSLTQSLPLLPFDCGGRYVLTNDEIKRWRSSQEKPGKGCGIAVFP
jgi:hypothetical protein